MLQSISAQSRGFSSIAHLVICAVGLMTAGLSLASSAAQADEMTYREGFQKGCMSKIVAKAQAKNVAVDANFQKMANATCTCSFDQLSTQLSPAQLAELQGPNPDPALIEQVRPILQQCVKNNLPK
ncbi:MAG: hypothetical protein ABWY00_19045 [Dongiaceae bacterium]